jgi:hypothetical chaperone protein
MVRARIGIDFGTTNSSVARVLPSGEVQLAAFPYMQGTTESFRSLLYLEQVKERGAHIVRSWSGPAGIEQYLAAENKGRLIQSLKSFLSSRSLQSTDVFGRRRKLEDLISRILRDLREQAEQQFEIKIQSAVVGRPVQFVGAETEDQNTYAQKRLEESFKIAGFHDIRFEMEPVAAAQFYESTLDHDELLLIGDFGGGTSDFSLLRVGPGVRSGLLGNAGVGIAGDAFDAKIVRHLVSPALGAGTNMRSMHKILPVPTWVYSNLERWHHLSFLRGRDTMNMLQSVKVQALEPRKIENLIDLIKEDLGYHLHRSVQQLKYDLSSQERARFHFSHGAIEIEAAVERHDFEEWIAPELLQIAGCVDRLMTAAGVPSAQVDMVFLTGGSSFVPAVRRIFETRFGKDRIRTGNEFTSVAAGLALKAS